MIGFSAAIILTLICMFTGREELAITGLFILALMYFLDEKFNGRFK